MTGGVIRAERNKSSAAGRRSSPAAGVWFHTPTSLAEASALNAVACLVCSSHQGLGEAAVGKDGAIGGTAQTGPMAGEITVILRGWSPPIHHGPYGTPQVSAKRCVCEYAKWYKWITVFQSQLRGHNLNGYMIWKSEHLCCVLDIERWRHWSYSTKKKREIILTSCT